MNEFDDDQLERDLSALYSADDLGEFRDRVMRRIEAVEEPDAALPSDCHSPSRQRWHTRLLAVTGTAVAIALLVLVFVLNPPGSTVQAAGSLRIQSFHGDVEIVGADGAFRELGDGAKLLPGDTLRTSGDSAATVLAHDGSLLTLMRNASLTWSDDGSGSVVLNMGLASIVGMPTQGEAFVVFKTQHATIEAPDTELVVATSDRQTDVTVRRGDARVTCRSGRSVKVKTGQCGVARKQVVEVRQGTAAPDEWHQDFETGIPDGFEGKHVARGLPEGSAGAITTILSRTENGSHCHQIFTSSDWEHGLVAIHDDTHLNFIYRFDDPQSVIAKLNLRSPFPDSPKHQTHLLHNNNIEFKERWWNVPAGQWYRVSLPVSRFRTHRSKREGPKPEPSSIVVSVALRPKTGQSGILIDRMWLSRGGSDDVVFEPYDGDEIQSDVSSEEKSR